MQRRISIACVPPTHLLPSSMFSHSTSNVIVSSVSMSNDPLATPELRAAVTRVGRAIPFSIAVKKKKMGSWKQLRKCKQYLQGQIKCVE